MHTRNYQTGSPYDLHMHSNFSDGVLSPTELMQRAHACGVRVVALTDHDTLAGLAEAQAAAKTLGNLECINGVEITVTWANTIIHVVGLRIDPNHSALQTALTQLKQQRAERGKAMALKIEFYTQAQNVWQTVCQEAISEDAVTRTHFARYLVEHHRVKTYSEAFDLYLKEGKKAYVPMQGLSLQQAVQAIQEAGGWAVLAHPGRYQRLNMVQLQALLTEFKSLGGAAIEVYTGSHAPHQYAEFERVAKQYDFYRSMGSDFHAPNEGRLEIGQLPMPDAQGKWVWTLWEHNE